MKVTYLETSALLRWLLGQSDAEKIRHTVDQADHVLTSVLTMTETERALIRAESEGLLREGDGRRLRGLLSRAQASWMRMAITEAVLARAARPFPIEPVRTLDAIHLASALEFATVFPELTVSSSDERICRNSESLGIA